MLAKINLGFRMWMPTFPMTLVSVRSPTEKRAASAVFRVPPRMTKHEIKEYLTKIYQLPVLKVNTMNYMGKRKQAIGRRGVARWKYRDFKKAIVSFDRTLTDVGLGTRMLEEATEPAANEQKQIEAKESSA